MHINHAVVLPGRFFFSPLQIEPQHLDIYVINLAKASDKLPHFLLHWLYLELTRTPENEEAA